MSRGIGMLQRDIIAAGGATRTIWDVLPSVSFNVAHDTPTQELRDTGNTWRTDGKPYFKGDATASSLAEYVELRKKYRAVWFKDMDTDGVTWTTAGCTEEFVSACWLEDSIYVAVYPDLFAVDHRVPTHIKRADGRDVWAQMMLPDDVRKAKASAKSNVVRAMRSLVARHYVTEPIYLLPSREVSDARGWKRRYGQRGRPFGWARLVLHPDALSLQRATA